MITIPNPIRIGADETVLDVVEEVCWGEAVVDVEGFVLLAPEVGGGLTFQSLFFIEEPVIGAIDIMLLRLAQNIWMIVNPFFLILNFVTIEITGNNYGAVIALDLAEEYGWNIDDSNSISTQQSHYVHTN